MTQELQIKGPVDGYYRTDGKGNWCIIHRDDDKGKTPAHPWQDGKDGAFLDSFGGADACHSFSAALSDWAGYLDFDDPKTAQCAAMAIKNTQVNNRQLMMGIAKTTHGGAHIRFCNRKGSRTGELIVTKPYGPHTLLACGLVGEIKVGAKLNAKGDEVVVNQSQTLKCLDAYRDLIYPINAGGEYPALANWDELPVWLQPIGRAQDAWDIVGLKAGKGRHDALIKLASRCSHAHMRKEDIKLSLQVANERVFGEPLPADEMSGIYDFVDGLVPGEAEFLDAKGNVDLLALSDHLRNSLDIVKIGGVLHVPDEYGIYGRNTLPVRRRARELAHVLPNQRDVIEKDLADIAPEKTKSDYRYIAFANGVLDIKTMEFREDWARELVLTNMIPHDYVPDAPAVEAVDNLLDAFAMDPATGEVDKGMVDGLGQVLGSCLYDIPTAGQGIYLVGPGGSGKSSYEGMVRWLVGDDNVCARSMDELTGDFILQELYNRKVLIADDISDEHVKGKGESVYKSLIGGAVKDASVKFSNQSLRFHSYATPIFSCNNMPTFADKNDSITRRVVIFPFVNRFRPGMTGYKADILEDIKGDEQAAQYLIRLAVEGLQRLISNGNYIVTDSVRMEAAMNEWLDDQQPLNSWYQCMDGDPDGVPVAVVVADANKYLASLGKREVSAKALNRYLRTKGYTTRMINTPKRLYVWDGIETGYGKACVVYVKEDSQDGEPGLAVPTHSPGDDEVDIDFG